MVSAMTFKNFQAIGIVIFRLLTFCRDYKQWQWTNKLLAWVGSNRPHVVRVGVEAMLSLQCVIVEDSDLIVIKVEIYQSFLYFTVPAYHPSLWPPNSSWGRISLPLQGDRTLRNSWRAAETHGSRCGRSRCRARPTSTVRWGGGRTTSLGLTSPSTSGLYQAAVASWLCKEKILRERIANKMFWWNFLAG